MLSLALYDKKRRVNVNLCAIEFTTGHFAIVRSPILCLLFKNRNPPSK